jgi:CheY-like chemotaxis protein
MTELTFQSRSKEAALGFLRSAVVFDDQPFLTDELAPQIPTAPPDPTLTDIPIIVAPDQEPEEGRLDIDIVVRGFASLGIVCGAIRPQRTRPGDPPDQAILRAAQRADLIVLDWELYRDDGVQALGLIRALASQPARGWLVIAVYTKHQRLGEIADRIEAVIVAARGSAERAGLVVNGSGLSIHILAKPTLDGGGDPSPESVTAGELPARLVEIFAGAAGGLLSNAALRGLAALRDEALGILKSFDSAADAGFLAHRLLLPKPSDSEDHALALLAAELADVLETAGVEDEVSIGAVGSWMASRGFVSDASIPMTKWDRVFKPSTPTGRLQAVLTGLEAGTEGLLANGNPVTLQDHGFRAAAGLFCTPDVEAARANARFTELMLMRSRRATAAPALGLGTILEGDGHVWVSIQPACDCIRIRAATLFPLIPLVPSDERGEFSLVFLDGDVAKYFRPPRKFRDVEMRRFSPDIVRGEIVALRVADDWVFTGEDEVTYRWIGELREQHAQRLARRFADRLSRFGLDEPEWLRLAAGGSKEEA